MSPWRESFESSISCQKSGVVIFFGRYLPMDTATLFTIVVIIIAIILVAVGVYLILVLHEARHSLRKINHVLDHVESVVDIIDTKIARPASSLSGVLVAIKEGLQVIRSFKKSVSKKEDHE